MRIRALSAGIILLWLASCAAERENQSLPKLELLAVLSAVAVVQYARSSSSLSCSSSSRSVPRDAVFADDTPPFSRAADSTALVVGDSTTAIGLFVPGFYSETTELIGFPGYTCCDMAESLSSAQAESPEKVMVSSACGNDLLGGAADDVVVANGRYLFDRVAARYGGTKLVAVAVHPTLVDPLNARKDQTNAALQTYVEGLGGCWIPMLSIFGVNAGERAPESLMLDAIHYNETVYAELKSAAESLCGVVL